MVIVPSRCPRETLKLHCCMPQDRSRARTRSGRRASLLIASQQTAQTMRVWEGAAGIISDRGIRQVGSSYVGRMQQRCRIGAHGQRKRVLKGIKEPCHKRRGCDSRVKREPRMQRRMEARIVGRGGGSKLGTKHSVDGRLERRKNVCIVRVLFRA